MNSKVIYSALFGSYDIWEEPKYVNEDYDYVLFTDQPIKSTVYKVVHMNKEEKLERKIKILCHKYLPDYDVWIWHDASMRQLMDANIFFSWMTRDMMCMAHPTRNCVYQEAKQCKLLKKGKPNIIDAQIEKYKKEGYPPHNGMIASGLMVRKNTKEVKDLCNRWWKEVERYSRRDQLSFNYCLQGKEIDHMPFGVLGKHFSIKHHNRFSNRKMKNLMRKRELIEQGRIL